MAQLKLTASKFYFEKNEVNIFDLVVISRVVKVHEKNEQYIQEFLKPLRPHIYLFFLGLDGWYGRFICFLAEKSDPHHTCTSEKK